VVSDSAAVDRELNRGPGMRRGRGRITTTVRPLQL
jgi:hypothetical protein